MTAAASRRPAATPPVEQAPPPPLQQPDLHGRRQDPAAEAWLPESTLDPATRAWLTGADRGGEQQPQAVPVQRPDDFTPRTAPSHVHGSDPGLTDWSGQQTGGAAPLDPAVPARSAASSQAEEPLASPEPPLDPDAYPSDPDSAEASAEDPEVTRLAERPAAQQYAPEAGAAGPVAPRWSPPAEQVAAPAPSGPSWWVGRSTAANDASADDAAGEPAADAEPAAPGAASDDPVAPSAVVSPPQPGDTAVVEPLVDRRPRRAAPLVTPGAHATTCHVCGHRLEPDDIFCAECGAVRPAVTAAFTGPIVPLPMDRPDWAADEAGEAPDDAHTIDAPEGDATAGDAPTGDALAGASASGVVGTEDEAADDGTPVHGTPADPTPEAPRDADGEDSAGSTGVLPTWVNGGGDGATAGDVPARRRGLHAAPDSESPAVSGPVIPPVPGSATVPSSAPSAQDSGVVGVPTAAPLPPLPGVDSAASPAPRTTDAPTSADGDLEDDVDETRIVSATPTRAPFVLHFSTGERFGVHGTGLVGRLPRPQPGERFDDLLTVHDPGKSVSKTHLELGRDGDDLWVSDRFSGNGTVVRHIDGSIRRCEPGRRYRVERGARVDIGEQFFLVQ
ncbi:FHA domain-containing protein [Curtobacterium sp. A7_M15]|uniref:FHA domain-containing protein n=1 Tax=Curtobacterium sp. A7_M15 TaxID=3065241 RepID=UPI002737F742|nr:FHA domain-containing protein [Curtobacterium sp. A7_M15]MDP4334443.1 FHA domain-containing protein [Curtobacterium sp. A7_M15]